jgi:outer membrane protein OmpA-like peptidoglycan-associated protein
VTAFQENMQALKSNWFLRGFFKNRGYRDATELTKHAIPNLPKRPHSNRFEIAAKDLFDKPDTAKLKNEKVLNQLGIILERTPYDLIVVAAYSGVRGDTDDNLLLTQARAMVVRQHFADHFKIDDQRIKTIGMGEDPSTPDKRAARVAIIVYPGQGTPAAERVTPTKNPAVSSH